MAKREAIRMAEAVREACVEAALRAWESGGVSGLCAEGRWELAVDAIRALDLERLPRVGAPRRGGGVARRAAPRGRAR